MTLLPDLPRTPAQMQARIDNEVTPVEPVAALAALVEPPVVEPAAPQVPEAEQIKAEADAVIAEVKAEAETVIAEVKAEAETAIVEATVEAEVKAEAQAEAEAELSQKQALSEQLEGANLEAAVEMVGLVAPVIGEEQAIAEQLEGTKIEADAMSLVADGAPPDVVEPLLNEPSFGFKSVMSPTTVEVAPPVVASSVVPGAPKHSKQHAKPASAPKPPKSSHRR